MSTAQISTLSDTLKELLDDARRTGEPVRIVEDGAVVARIVPESPPNSAHSHHDTQRIDIDQLRAEISMTWPSEISAVDAIRADRSRLDEDPAARRARAQAALDRLKQINADPFNMTPRDTVDTGTDETGAILDRLWSLGDEMSTRWPKGISAIEAIRDVRREL